MLRIARKYILPILFSFSFLGPVALSLWGLYPFVLILNFLHYIIFSTVVVMAVLIFRGFYHYVPGPLLAVVALLIYALLTPLPASPKPDRSDTFELVYQNARYSPSSQRRLLKKGRQRAALVAIVAEPHLASLKKIVGESSYWNTIKTKPGNALSEKVQKGRLAVIGRRSLGTYEISPPRNNKLGIIVKNRQILTLHARAPRTYDQYKSRNETLRGIDRKEHDLIVGDFNATTWSLSMGKLAQNYRYASPFSASGTWPATLPFVGIGIDHVLTKVPANARIGTAKISDHHPLFVTVEL